jgi:hypothetical protein
MNTKFSQSIMSSGSRYTQWIELYKFYKRNKLVSNETSSVIDWFKTMILGDAVGVGPVTILGRELYDKIKEGFAEASIRYDRRRPPRNPDDDTQAALVEAGFYTDED